MVLGQDFNINRTESNFLVLASCIYPYLVHCTSFSTLEKVDDLNSSHSFEKNCPRPPIPTLPGIFYGTERSG
jgi:hypothetical protein